MKQLKTYYRLPTDNDGQPSGWVEEIKLTPEEFDQRKRTEWIFKNYIQALCRAQD